MGTANIDFGYADYSSPSCLLKKRVNIEIGKIIFRALLEAIEAENTSDSEWKSKLNAAYGIDYLWVGRPIQTSGVDYGPWLLKAIDNVRRYGSPNYYPSEDMDMLYQTLDLLEKTYLEIRLAD